MAGAYLIALLDQYTEAPSPFPLALNVVFCSILFFHLGYEFKQRQLIQRKHLWVSLPLALVGVTLVLLDVPLWFNMKYSHYGLPALSVVFSIAGILVIFALADQLARMPLLARGFGYVGAASITIMFLHQWFHLRLFEYRLPLPEPLEFALSLLAPLVLHLLLTRHTLGRAAFLGDQTAGRSLAERWSRRPANALR